MNVALVIVLPFVVTNVVKAEESPTSPCENCPYRNGLYRAKHESNCCRYYDCVKTASGFNPIERKCGGGRFWNDARLTCDHPEDANCLTDSCIGSPDGNTVSDGCTCYGFLTCLNGASTSWWHCNNNFAFNPATGTCVPDASCTLPTTVPVTPCTDPNMKGHPTDNTKYIWTVDGVDQVWDCPPGSIYDTSICICDHGGSATCSPEIDIDFSSEQWFFDDITLTKVDGRDVGHFDGIDSRITLPVFANIGELEFFSVSITFKETFTDTVNNYVLFSNCDCDVPEGCSIRSFVNRHSGNDNDIMAQADTTNSAGIVTATKTATNAAGNWKTHHYVFYNGNLKDWVGSSYGEKNPGGKIENRKMALHIGYDGCLSEMKPFVGYIDNIIVTRHLCPMDA